MPFSAPQKVAFIEDKAVAYDRLADLLQLSAQANHWANFGPVAQLLEQFICKQLNLPYHGKALLTSSCSTALEVIAQGLSFKLGRQARFLTSGFAFFSTYRGSFGSAQVVDCDEQGFICLERIAQVPLDSYDAIVFTNIFGLGNDTQAHWEFADSNNKYLVIDNAAGYTAFPQRKVPEMLLEAVSFHHTKPHGFGEGGCVLAHDAWTPSLRAISNFGARLFPNNLKVGLNAKLSESSAAFILQRLEQHTKWAPQYIGQAKRIRQLAEGVGLSALVPNTTPEASVPGQLPFLSERLVSKESLENELVTLRKYYLPFATHMPNSQRIYNHIVSLPCHPDMATIEDSALEQLFSTFS